VLVPAFFVLLQQFDESRKGRKEKVAAPELESAAGSPVDEKV